jgi:glycosyltransferase involved in cell wall biosynthesis
VSTTDIPPTAGLYRRDTGRLRVAVLWLGRISRDTAGRTYLSELLGPLGDRQGLDVDVHLGDADFAVPDSCRAFYYRVPYALGAPGRILAEPAVAARIARAGYDVLLAPGNFLPSLWRGPAVLVQHNVLAFGPRVGQEVSRLRAWYRPRKTASSLARATEVIAISSYLRRLLLEHHPALDPTRVHVVPYGRTRALDHVAIVAGDRPRRHVVVVSALWPYKRVDQAIEVFAEATRDISGCRLSIAGPGSPAERARLEQLTRRVGADVRFLGNVPHDRLPELYAGADALLYLSEVESFGMPLLEAMAAGVPAIAKRIEGLVEIGASGPAWVDLDTPSTDVAAVLRRLLTDADARSARVGEGTARAAEFDWEITAELTAGVLRKAVTRTPSPRARTMP